MMPFSIGKVITPKYTFIWGSILAVSAIFASMVMLPTFQAVVGIFFAMILIGAGLCDMQKTILPNRLTLGGILIALILAVVIPLMDGFGLNEVLMSLNHSIIGLLIGSSILMWIGLTAEIVLKKEAIGFGDVKFMGCIGAFCGWKGAIFAIFGGAFLGTLILLPILAYKKSLDKEIPFGPWLAVASFIYFVFIGERVDEFLSYI